MTILQSAYRYTERIQRSGLSIYDEIKVGDANYWIPSLELEALLDIGLRDLDLQNLPVRSRSKLVKQKICQLLGYPTPSSFRKTNPRFIGQQFDTYTQKSNNLQIWNQAIAPTKRYVLIGVSGEHKISRVKVVTGDVLAELDTTGTLTKKYQARCIPGVDAVELISPIDTELVAPLTTCSVKFNSEVVPISHPSQNELLQIKELKELLSPLIGATFPDPGSDQERLRGASLHRLVCEAIGYATYRDSGQFPDIPHQLLEIKLQTSPTIDLGLALPNSIEPIDVPMIANRQLRHCDVRYAVFYARITGGLVEITHLFLTTGEKFFVRFQQFQGKVLNSKLQIRLPNNFFS